MPIKNWATYLRRRGIVTKSFYIFVSIVGLVGIFDTSGIYIQLRERDYATEFSWSLEAPDFIDIVNHFRKGDILSLKPLNTYYSSISWITPESLTCDEPVEILILVKSAIHNSKNRQAIRSTHKKPPPGISSKVIFFVGKSQEMKKESDYYKDIVQIDFIDTYFNNTLKTMVEMRWATEECSNFKYALLVDDDYFVSVKNLHKYINQQSQLPTGGKLYAGYKMFPKPLRHKIFNKWFVPLEEYPFSRFPPYITAGAILLSKSALQDIHYASYFTKHFRLDDIFVAICAKKMGLSPTHTEDIHFHEKEDDSPDANMIASHGFRDPNKLLKYWEIQKSHSYV